MDNSKDYFEVDLGNPEKDQFNWIWLKDNCHCEKCFNSNCNQKYFDSADILLDIKPTNITEFIDRIEIKWPDDCSSIYEKSWLRTQALKISDKVSTDLIYPSFKTWEKATLEKTLKPYLAGDILDSDNLLRNFLEDLYTYGIVIIRAIEDESGLEKIFDQIAGFVNRTYYGQVFDLYAKPVTKMDNVAFSTARLPLHTDLCYYEQPPDYQFLYGLEVKMNGVSQLGNTKFADGFYAATILKREYPGYFEALRNSVVTFRAEFPLAKKEYINKTTIIHTQDEKLIKVINNPTKMFIEGMPLEEEKLFYEAYSTFKKMLDRPENKFSFEWRQGDFVLIDNYRIFHGRDDFDSTDAKRILRGGYFSRTELNGRYAYLKKRESQAC